MNEKEFVLAPVDVMRGLVKQEAKRDFALGEVALALAKQGFEKGVPVKYAMRIEEKEGNLREKAYLISDSETGGPFQEISYWEELVPLLRNKSIIRQNADRLIPIPTGKLALRKQKDSVTAYWVGEGQNIAKSSGKYEQVLMVPKKLAAIAVFSNDILRYTGNTMAQAVQQDLVETIAAKEDETFILSDGSSTNTPKGLLGFAPSANKIALGDMSEVEAIKTMLGSLAASLAYKKPIWIMPPQAKIHLQFLQNDNGAFVFPEVQQNLLAGFPVFTTTLIPYASGETKVFLVDASEMLIGQGVTLTLEFFPNGAFYDGENVVSGISADESVFRVLEEVDFFLKHDAAVVVLEEVTWGAL